MAGNCRRLTVSSWVSDRLINVLLMASDWSAYVNHAIGVRHDAPAPVMFIYLPDLPTVYSILALRSELFSSVLHKTDLCFFYAQLTSRHVTSPHVSLPCYLKHMAMHRARCTTAAPGHRQWTRERRRSEIYSPWKYKKVQQSWQTSALATHLPLARLVSMPVIFCLPPCILVFYLFSTGISEQHAWELWV